MRTFLCLLSLSFSLGAITEVHKAQLLQINTTLNNALERIKYSDKLQVFSEFRGSDEKNINFLDGLWKSIPGTLVSDCDSSVAYSSWKNALQCIKSSCARGPIPMDYKDKFKTSIRYISTLYPALEKEASTESPFSVKNLPNEKDFIIDIVNLLGSLCVNSLNGFFGCTLSPPDSKGNQKIHYFANLPDVKDRSSFVNLLGNIDKEDGFRKTVSALHYLMTGKGTTQESVEAILNSLPTIKETKQAPVNSSSLTNQLLTWFAKNNYSGISQVTFDSNMSFGLEILSNINSLNSSFERMQFVRVFLSISVYHSSAMENIISILNPIVTKLDSNTKNSTLSTKALMDEQFKMGVCSRLPLFKSLSPLLVYMGLYTKHPRTNTFLVDTLQERYTEIIGNEQRTRDLYIKDLTEIGTDKKIAQYLSTKVDVLENSPFVFEEFYDDLSSLPRPKDSTIPKEIAYVFGSTPKEFLSSLLASPVGSAGKTSGLPLGIVSLSLLIHNSFAFRRQAYFAQKFHDTLCLLDGNYKVATPSSCPSLPLPSINLLHYPFYFSPLEEGKDECKSNVLGLRKRATKAKETESPPYFTGNQYLQDSSIFAVYDGQSSLMQNQKPYCDSRKTTIGKMYVSNVYQSLSFVDYYNRIVLDIHSGLLQNDKNSFVPRYNAVKKLITETIKPPFSVDSSLLHSIMNEKHTINFVKNKLSASFKDNSKLKGLKYADEFFDSFIPGESLIDENNEVVDDKKLNTLFGKIFLSYYMDLSQATSNPGHKAVALSIILHLEPTISFDNEILMKKLYKIDRIIDCKSKSVSDIRNLCNLKGSNYPTYPVTRASTISKNETSNDKVDLNNEIFSVVTSKPNLPSKREVSRLVFSNNNLPEEHEKLSVNNEEFENDREISVQSITHNSDNINVISENRSDQLKTANRLDVYLKFLQSFQTRQERPFDTFSVSEIEETESKINPDASKQLMTEKADFQEESDHSSEFQKAFSNMWSLVNNQRTTSRFEHLINQSESSSSGNFGALGHYVNEQVSNKHSNEEGSDEDKITEIPNIPFDPNMVYTLFPGSYSPTIEENQDTEKHNNHNSLPPGLSVDFTDSSSDLIN